MKALIATLMVLVGGIAGSSATAQEQPATPGNLRSIPDIPIPSASTSIQSSRHYLILLRGIRRNDPEDANGDDVYLQWQVKLNGREVDYEHNWPLDNGNGRSPVWLIHPTDNNALSKYPLEIWGGRLRFGDEVSATIRLVEDDDPNPLPFASTTGTDDVLGGFKVSVTRVVVDGTAVVLSEITPIDAPNGDTYPSANFSIHGFRTAQLDLTGDYGRIFLPRVKWNYKAQVQILDIDAQNIPYLTQQAVRYRRVVDDEVIEGRHVEQPMVTERTGTKLVDGFVGQSVTLPKGDIIPGLGFKRLSFSWYDASRNPTAFGNLYILFQSYQGSPNDLSESTEGFVALSACITEGRYLFAPEVGLPGGREFYFYADAKGPHLTSLSSTYGLGAQYAASGGSAPFGRQAGDANFQLIADDKRYVACLPSPPGNLRVE